MWKSSKAVFTRYSKVITGFAKEYHRFKFTTLDTIAIIKVSFFPYWAIWRLALVVSTLKLVYLFVY